MAFQISAYMFAPIIAGIFSLGIAYFVWSRRQSRAAAPLFVMLLATSFWAFVYGLEIGALDLDFKLFWAQLKYIGIVATPLAWFLFAVIYTERDEWLQPVTIIALSIIPIVTIILTLTNELHHLVWVGKLDDSGSFLAYVVEFRYWFWLHTAFSYLMVLAAFFLIAAQYRRADATAKKQIAVLLAAGIFPFAGNVLFVAAGDLLKNLDITPIMFVLTGFFLAIGLFPLRMLENPEDDGTIAYSLDTEISEIILGSRRQTLRLLLTGSIILCFFSIMVGLMREYSAGQPNWNNLLLLALPAFTFAIIAAVRGAPFELRTVAFLGAWLFISLISIRQFGLDLESGVNLLTFVIFAFFLLGMRGGLVALAISGLTVVGAGYQIFSGQFAPASRLVAGSSGIDLFFSALNFFMLILTATLAQSNLQRFVTDLFNEAQALSKELDAERALLENRVADRTRDLETSFAITRHISEVDDKEALFASVVDQLRQQFGFYHVFVFLLNEAENRFDFTAGSGEIGQQLKRLDLSLPADRGLMGNIRNSKNSVVVDDVTLEPEWIENEYLPTAKAEAIVPILLGDKMFGVLGIQSDKIAGIHHNQISLVEAIASQMAVIIQKLDTLAQAEQQTKAESALNQVVQQIRQTTGIDRAAKIAIREMGRALGKPAAILLADAPPQLARDTRPLVARDSMQDYRS